jgi:hypothetical protein
MKSRSLKAKGETNVVSLNVYDGAMGISGNRSPWKRTQRRLLRLRQIWNLLRGVSEEQRHSEAMKAMIKSKGY